MAEINVSRDAEELAVAVADHVASAAADAIAAHGRFAVALAGGSTPRAMYEHLASREFAASIDWSRVHLFWADERCVPPDHADSNYRMVREALVDHVPVPESNIHRIPGELDPDKAAAEYERALRTFFAEHPPRNVATTLPRFDLVLLGMGEDGHTASLFPGDPVLNEQERWVAAVGAPAVEPRLPRVTLTLPVINAAGRVYFLVTGGAKQNVCRSILDNPLAARATYPAAMARPQGELIWFVDRAAAGQTPEGE